MVTTNSQSAPPIGIAPPGYRLPDATHVGRVRLQVSDLARSTTFYENVLGLRVLSGSGDVATLGPQGGKNPIVELRAKPGVRPVPRRGLIGLYHYAILLPNRAALGRFVGHLAERGVYAGMSDHLVSEAIYLQDPDGLGIEVYADRPRSAWRYADRQLTMATAPLDVRDLTAAAGGEPWTGAPEGTTMGHVHLHVRDIAQAEAFYHRALGFDKVVWNYPGALFMSAGGYHHHLGTNTWAAEAPAPAENDAHLLDWELVLPAASDVDQAAKSLEGAGAAVPREGGAALASDPWGTKVRLISER